ncbi:VWA domain-containing protein [Nonomuraea jabiensis]|uniref:Ca-activated chloride channel family protein n=1 Tax=Nonomuraea jabiensis TaxID=882448 RepID=A0A7W9FY77_9ACTN|nr:VWA domain-containing protein [Nonomuraea jabiensis]MBB5773733.1 Ca-activated chloride channel family protein [Nonomuraea jabiensis]
MHITAHLDLTVVPFDQDDEVTLMLEIAAPPPAIGDRPPATVQVVLDRSGSMGGARLAGAQRALLGLVDRLDPADNFGLVSFSNSARVELPAGPLAHKAAAKRTIEALRPMGSTDLSSGLLRGIQEARRVADERSATLLLISDGHANEGIVNHELLADIARDAHQHGVTTTALGYGLDYDERLIAAIADGGAGSSLHATEADTAVQLIASEVGVLLSKVVQAASLTITPRTAVSGLRLYGDLPCTQRADGAVVTELGDFYGGETRKLLIRMPVAGMAVLGLATVAELEFTYVESRTLTTYTVTVPVSVNVVPGDQAAGRIPNPVVRAEQLFHDAQEAKRRASDALLRGDVNAAEAILNAAGDALERSLAWAPNADEFLAEMEKLRRHALEARHDAARISKQVRSEWHMRTRKRGRSYDDREGG